MSVRARRRLGVLLIGVIVVFASARPAVLPVREPDVARFDRQALSRVEEAELVELITTGHSERALEQLRHELDGYPRHCAPYHLAVEAARRAGTLAALTLEWERRLQLHLDDPFLLVGYAAALEAQSERTRAKNLLARAVREQTPCAAAYERFVRLSQLEGRLGEAENVLVARAAPPSSASAWLNYGRGLVHETNGNLARAIAAYRRGALHRQRPPSELFYRGAALLERSGDLRQALVWSDEGSAVAERDGSLAMHARLLGQRAGLLYRLERSEESLDALQRASALPSMEPQVLASMFLRQAYLSSARGERERAAELDQRARAVDLENARDELAAQVEAEIGMSELRASRFREARNRFESSLGLARRSGDAFAIWDAHIGLAHVDLMEGSSYRALEAITPLLERSLELEDARRQTQALELAATIYERVGSFDRALVLYRLVLSGTELQGDVGRRALTIGNIALVEMRLGLEASALAHAEQAVRLAPRARDRRLETGLLQALGAALAGTGRFAQARLIYERALVSSQHLESPELTGLLYSGLGRVLLALGESELAAHRFRDALGVDAEGSRLVRLQALSGLALTEWRRGQLREALALFDSSLELVESFRRSIVSESDRLHYQETRFTIYANLTGVLTELDERYPEAGYGERAFELVERSRARALRDVLERSVGETSPPLLELGATSSTAASELLKASEVLLEYVLGDERSTLWVITRDGWAHHTLPPRAVIEREVIRYLKTLRAPPRSPSNPFDAHLEPSALLYKLLVEPAAAHWVDGQHLIIAPHGVLHHLPFEALGAPAAGGELRYLVESHNVTYIPSLSVLGGLSRRLAGPRGSDGAGVDFVGFAQSSPRLALALPQGVLPSIPFADAEIQAASGSFSPGRFRLFPTRVANEASLKQELAAHHRIVHIAAHALADRSRPERSAIFVGADELEREDGVLSMREVTALSVGARLVVLSGCETGLGRVMEIEGTLGFTWAFLSAGASSVGVSLWNVNDRASAEVMERFYSGVGAGQPLAEALANAKRQMLQSTRRAYRHPYFWAPMIVVGLDAALEIDR